MVKDTTLYDRLKINSDASDNDIKKAYRKLSIKLHPDKNPDKDTTNEFQSITEAYTILKDPEKRKMYDNIGMNYVKNGDQPNIDPNEIFKNFFGGSGFPGGFENMFGGFRGGMGGMGGFPFGRNTQQRSNNLDNCVIEKFVTLEEIYNEKLIVINYDSKISCNACNGYGTKDKKTSTCKSCKGNGKNVRVVNMGHVIQQIMSECNDCNGTGEYINKNNICNTCAGLKTVLKSKSVEFNLQRNLNDDSKIILKNKGHNYKEGKTDLIIVIKIKEHPYFKKNYNNLFVDMNIKLYQCVFGFKKTLKHLDGRELLIELPPLDINSYSEDIHYVVKKEGMYDKHNNKGDLIIKFNIDSININNLDEKEVNILQKLLVKIDIDDYNNINNIKKANKVKLKRVKINYNNDENTQSSNEDSPGECVTQ
jgi:DnaJ-class molecular chaperone